MCVMGSRNAPPGASGTAFTCTWPSTSVYVRTYVQVDFRTLEDKNLILLCFVSFRLAVHNFAGEREYFTWRRMAGVFE